MSKTLKIWCTYHNENIPKEYNLYNTNNIQLFNDDDRTLSEDNINYLHDYLGEMTTYYYVWKNQIKTDYVGFCQYKRHFITIDYDILERDGLFAYWNCIYNDETLYDANYNYIGKNIFFDFINFIYYKYGINIHDIIFINKGEKIAFHSMIVYKWEIFNEVCEYIFGFLDYMTNGTWKDENKIIHLAQYYHLKDIDYKKENLFNIDWYWSRGLAITSEILLGIFVNIKYNLSITSGYHFSIYDKYFISLDECDIQNFEDFEKWYKINIKTGIVYFYVDINILNKLKNIGYDLSKFNYLYSSKPYVNLKEIKLKINEKIECDDSIEFYKGNYTINNF